jgi:hypothetical protein
MLSIIRDRRVNQAQSNSSNLGSIRGRVDDLVGRHRTRTLTRDHVASCSPGTDIHQSNENLVTVFD